MIRRPPRSTLFPSPTLFRSPSFKSGPSGYPYTGFRSSGGVAPARGIGIRAFATSLPDSLARRVWVGRPRKGGAPSIESSAESLRWRSEEHTSELQSLAYLVCRLLLEKKKNTQQKKKKKRRKCFTFLLVYHNGSTSKSHRKTSSHIPTHK